MVEASQEAALIIEGCENKHHLTREEALDVLSGCVVSYIMGDGQTDSNNMARRFEYFFDHLQEYIENVVGIKFYQDEDNIGN